MKCLNILRLGVSQNTSRVRPRMPLEATKRMQAHPPGHIPEGSSLMDTSLHAASASNSLTALEVLARAAVKVCLSSSLTHPQTCKCKLIHGLPFFVYKCKLFTCSYYVSIIYIVTYVYSIIFEFVLHHASMSCHIVLYCVTSILFDLVS